MRAGIRNANDLQISGRVGCCSSNETMINRCFFPTYSCIIGAFDARPLWGSEWVDPNPGIRVNLIFSLFERLWLHRLVACNPEYLENFWSIDACSTKSFITRKLLVILNVTLHQHGLDFVERAFPMQCCTEAKTIGRIRSPPTSGRGTR